MTAALLFKALFLFLKLPSFPDRALAHRQRKRTSTARTRHADREGMLHRGEITTGVVRSQPMDICSAEADLTVLRDCSQQDCVWTYRSVRHAHNHRQNCPSAGRAGVCARAPPAHAPPDPPICWKGYVSCVVAVATPQGGGLSVCRCATPAYPLSPTRCWRYRFSYPDFGGDCGLGRCKRPAEARCLPRCQSRRLGSRRLNPLLNSHIQTKNDSPRWEKCWRKLVLKSHRRAKLRPDQPVRGVKNVEVQLEAHAAEDNAMVSWLSMQTSEEQQRRREKNHCEHEGLKQKQRNHDRALTKQG